MVCPASWLDVQIRKIFQILLICPMFYVGGVRKSHATGDFPMICRADKSSYIAFFFIGGGPCLCFALAPLFGRAILWEPIEFGACTTLFFFVWLASFRVVLGAEHITYRTLFSTPTTLAYKDVQRVRFEVNTSDQDKPFGPTVRLVVSPRSQTGQRDMVINAKVFSRECLREIEATLTRNSSGH